MKCQFCGGELEEGAKFCRDCGQKVVLQKRFCRECGAELQAGVRFCAGCGANVEEMNKIQNGVHSNQVNVANNPTTNSAPTVNLSNPTPVSSYIPRPSDIPNYDANNSGSNYSSSSSTGTNQSTNANRSSYTPNNINRNTTSSSWMSPKFLIPIVAIVAVFFIAIAGIIIGKMFKGDSINSLGVPESLVAESEQQSALDTRYQYAYMSDDWNVYIAVPISESVIKIEHWRKGLRTDKELEYSSDIGTYKITDESTDFYWVDDSHTTFVISFSDRNNSHVKKSIPRAFTINLNESAVCKGTDYDSSIACYSMENDRWHMYRAIALTDELIKIECWSRGVATGDYLFGYDVCVFNVNDNELGFEWSDESHKAFTVEMKDPENGSYWKEKSLVAFTLENSDYTYSTVSQYLGISDSTGTTNVEKTPKDAFDTSEKVEYTMGNYTFTIPTYWESDVEHGDTYRAYAETGDSVAMFMITRSYDDADPVSDEILTEDTENGLMSQSFQSWWDHSGDVEIEEFDNGVVKGYIYSLDFEQDDGLNGSCYVLCFPSIEDNNWFYVYIAESDNTTYSYYSDFEKICNSIVKAENAGDADNATEEASSVVEEENEEEIVEETTTEEVVEETVKYDEVVLPEAGTKLAKDFDSKGSSTVYYINVDGTSNKPTLKKWGGKTVTDGIAEYLDYLQDLGFTVKITNYDKSTPYAGFTLYEADFEVSNEYVTWTMYMCIEDEDYTEYELDIHLD